MDASQIIWGLRIIGGLAIGFLIARKFRDFIRSIVIMCIPLKHRISERSFQIQTRITTIVGILLAIGIAIGLNYGVTKAMTQMGITKTTSISAAGLSPKLPITKKSTTEQFAPNMPIQAPQETPPPIVPTPQKKEQLPNTYEFQQPTVSHKQQIDPNITATLQQHPLPYRQQPIHYTPTGQFDPAAIYQLPYYAQIYAFGSLEKAKRQQVLWQQGSPLPIQIGYDPTTRTPYKVIIGPFRNRPAAAYFLKTNQLEGFPKAAHQLQIFQ